MTDNEHARLEDFENASRKTYLYPAHEFSGRGIVICGGGNKYFPCVWVCINMLRKVGCLLPIELWHFSTEMSDLQKTLVSTLNVKCIDATEVRRKKPVRNLGGWELKPYAIIHSSFREVLLLDADNVVVVDPEFLFNTAPYKRVGAIFWPDYWRLGRERMAWKVTGVEYRDEPEFESGQIVVNKEICWRALQLTLHLCAWSDFFFKHFHGDKEAFHLAWRKLNQEYAMTTYGIHNIGGYCMAQHDFEGRRIFQHRNLRKWTLRNNLRDKNFLFEDDCINYLNALPKELTSEKFEVCSILKPGMKASASRIRPYIRSRSS